jgi:hypothetical protein
MPNRGHDVSIIRRPWHTVEVARHRPDADALAQLSSGQLLMMLPMRVR